MGFTVAASTSTREGEGASLPFLSASMPVLFFCDLPQKDAQHRKKNGEGKLRGQLAISDLPENGR